MYRALGASIKTNLIISGKEIFFHFL
jgi:hypothetical protein